MSFLSRRLDELEATRDRQGWLLFMQILRLATFETASAAADAADRLDELLR